MIGAYMVSYSAAKSEIKRLGEVNAELRAENARLREIVDVMGDHVADADEHAKERLQREMAGLRAEITRLKRELVDIHKRFAKHAGLDKAPPGVSGDYGGRADDQGESPGK